MSLEQPRFLRSLQMIEHAVNDRSALPILANVHLEIKESELILTATDLDVGVQYRVPVLDAPERGAVTVPARRLATIVRELPEEAVTLEAKTNHTALVSCGASRFRIPGLPPEDFPIFPPSEQTQSVVIEQGALKQLIEQTAFSMSIEETRFVLNGTLIRARDQGLVLVATDGRRLAVARGAAQTHGNADFSVVVPARTVRELGRLIALEDNEPVTIAPLKDQQLLFRFGSATVITRLIEGQFPQYESVIPAPSESVLTCSRELLMSAVRRASLMTTAASQAVVFDVGKDRLVVTKESAELGSAREELPATFTGAPMSIAFNPQFWLDALKTLDTDDVAIEMTTPEKPAVVRVPAGASTEQAAFVYVVLPMKLA